MDRDMPHDLGVLKLVCMYTSEGGLDWTLFLHFFCYCRCCFVFCFVFFCFMIPRNKVLCILGLTTEDKVGVGHIDSQFYVMSLRKAN